MAYNDSAQKFEGLDTPKNFSVPFPKSPNLTNLTKLPSAKQKASVGFNVPTLAFFALPLLTDGAKSGQFCVALELRGKVELYIGEFFLG